VGLSLQVGVARHVLIESAARDLEKALAEKAHYQMPTTDRSSAWSHRDDMDPAWVFELQAFAEPLGAFPQLGACDAWSTVYLPVFRQPASIEYRWSDGTVQIEGPEPLRSEMAEALRRVGGLVVSKPGPLAIVCGSLPLLREELHRLGARAGLPVEKETCKALIRARSGPARRCYGHFMLAVSVAQRREQPLWVVK
jgi:hypothetical protein